MACAGRAFRVKAVCSGCETCSGLAGRVKRCSSKQVDIVSLGALRLDPGWHNAGYIFPDGFTTSTVFRSSVRSPAPIHAVCSACSPFSRLLALGRACWHAAELFSARVAAGAFCKECQQSATLSMFDDQSCQGPCMRLKTPEVACS